MPRLIDRLQNDRGIKPLLQLSSKHQLGASFHRNYTG